jgi:hypothetical protein
MVRERVIFAELKAEKGLQSGVQWHWATLLKKAGAEVYLWRPSSWDAIVDTLTRRAA